MGKIEELFDRGTGGKCTKWQHYFEIYERYFGKFVGSACTYLEIGVALGGSLAIMQEYLGAAARVVGTDIEPRCAQLRNQGREIYIGDQADHAFLADLAAKAGPFDIIVDDGGHTADQQITSFFALFPHLKAGGVYLVEDLHATFWHPSFQSSRYGINFLDFAKGLADKMTLWHLDRESFLRFHVPPEERKDQFVIHNFAATQIFGIHFYDSVVVFEKRAIPEPYSMRK